MAVGMGFSVLMSLYVNESPSNLHECLESIFMQTLRSDCVVLIFDGPLNAALVSVVESWREQLNIRTFPLAENVGLGRALNIGLIYCPTDLVCRMDTDDLCEPTRFEKQINFLNNNPEIDICGSWIEEIHPETKIYNNTRKVPETDLDIKADMARRNPFNHMTVAYRKSAIERVGGYQHLNMMEDWYLWMRLLASGSKAYNIQECLVRARTGSAMLGRRSGWSYIRSEWAISKIKVDLGIATKRSAFIIFLFRSFPRCFPNKVIGLFYSAARVLH